MTRVITVDVWSDVVCPWCYLGKRRLEAALAARPALRVAVRFRPFELNPDLPAEGAERGAYLARKFGDPARSAAAHDQLVGLGRAVGIDFQFAAIRRVPNTRHAHALVALAGARGGEMVETLFHAYFEQGRDVGALPVLVDLARSIGVAGAALEGRLAAGEGLDSLAAAAQTAQSLRISGVPLFVFADRWGLVGAQEPAQLLSALDEVDAALAAEADANA